MKTRPLDDVTPGGAPEVDERLVETWADRFARLSPEWQEHIDDTARSGELPPGPILSE